MNATSSTTAQVAAIFGIILIGVVAMTLILPLDIGHVKERGHDAAELIHADYRDGVCDGKRVWYNITTGQIMIECQLQCQEPPPMCGLLIFQVTESAGTIVLTKDARTVTVYVVECHVIRNIYVNRNGGFLEWAVVPLDIKSAIQTTFGEP